MSHHHPARHPMHDHFREEGDIDWGRLAERQRQRIPLADAWWALLGRPVGQRLADVGCGPGILALHYAQLGADVLAVDLRADALAHVPRHPRIRTLLHDLEAAPLPGRVDVAVLTDVLHHARDPVQMLRHVRAAADRVLVAEYDPGAAGDVGPPLGARLAPHEVARLLADAGFAPEPPARTALEHYALAASVR